MAKKNSPGCACCGATGYVCSPCAIPTATLNLTLKYTNTSGGISTATIPLGYVGGPNWASTNPYTLSDYDNTSLPFPTASHYFQLQCNGGNIYLAHTVYYPNYPPSTTFVFGYTSYNSFTCTPFYVDFSTTGVSSGGTPTADTFAAVAPA